jgi:hypothetical protein
MASIDILKKLRLYKTNPALVQEMTPNEIADIALLVMSQVNKIEDAIKAGRLDGYTPQPDKDYLSKESALRLLSDAVNGVLSRVDTELGEKGTALDKAVSEAILRIQNGKDGIVSDEEIERAATIAFEMIELPDFDAKMVELVQGNGAIIRDALESLPEGEEQLKINAVQNLRKELDELKQAISRKTDGKFGGGIGKATVLELIAQNGGGISDGDKGDITVSGNGTVWSIDNDTIGQAELATTGTPDGSKFLRDDMVWVSIPGGGDALVANPLSQFAATTSLQLKGVISDETGSGALVFADTPTLVTPVLGVATATSINGATITSGTLNGTVSGTNTGDQTITLTSDVTGSGTGSFVTTIANNAVSLAKMADVATGTVFYRKTASTGDPEVQTLATLKTDLGLTGTNSGDQTSIVGITGTKAQFDTAVTDGNFMYVGDAPTSHTHLLSEITDSTTEALGVGSLEVGHASDTTITRVSAGVIAVEGTNLVKAGAATSSGLTMATSRVLGRTTAATGAIEELSTVDAFVSAASDTTAGKIEVATIAETNTGTDATRAVSPDGLSQSYAGTKSVSIQVFEGATDVTTGDGKAYITIPEALNGMNLIRAQATVVTAGTTNATTVMIHNKTDAQDMLSGAISIASAGTVGTVGTINGSFDDVATNDVLRIDVDSVSTTAPKGLQVVLEFRLP